MDQKEINEILEKHTKYLMGKKEGERANLREANLREANLYGANLYGADLREADLREANLREADLREANLYGADLRGANLREADLREADLYGADLRGADLYGANGLRYFQWDKHSAFFYKDRIQIGCEDHLVTEWAENYKNIGVGSHYSEEQIKAYKMFIDICALYLEKDK